MPRMNRALLIGCAAVCAVASGLCLESSRAESPQPVDVQAPSPRWEAIAEAFGGVKSETRPSRDATMSFAFATEVREVLVKGGQRVKRDEPLMRARDNEVVAAMAQQRSLAENELEIHGASAALELAEFRFEQLKRGGNFTPSEFEELRIQAMTARIQRDLAIFNREQQQHRLKQLEAQAERFLLTAPFDGVVSQVLVDVGQGVNEQQKVVRIVNTDQLWLDAWAGTEETMRLSLKDGAKAWVLVDVPDRPVVAEGRVIEVDPVADPVSQTRRIRVEIDNVAGWPAGTQARVRLAGPPPAGGNWAMLEPRAIDAEAAGSIVAQLAPSQDLGAMEQDEPKREQQP